MGRRKLSPYSTFARLSLHIVKLRIRLRRLKPGPSLQIDSVLTSTEYRDEDDYIACDGIQSRSSTSKDPIDLFSSSSPTKRGLEDAPVITQLGSAMCPLPVKGELPKDRMWKDVILEWENAVPRKSAEDLTP